MCYKFRRLPTKSYRDRSFGLIEWERSRWKTYWSSTLIGMINEDQEEKERDLKKEAIEGKKEKSGVVKKKSGVFCSQKNIDLTF